MGLENWLSKMEGCARSISTPLGVEDVGGAEAFAQAFEDGDSVGGMAGEGPGAHDVGLGVGEGADEGDGFVLVAEGKEVVLIAEEDGGLGGDVAGSGALLGRDHLRGGLRRIDVGILEEAEFVLGDEDVADGGVDGGLGDEAFADGVGECVTHGGAGHFHVDTGVDGADGSVFIVLGEAVGGEALDGGPVADDHAVEVPVVAEDVVEEEASCRWRGRR